MLSPRGLRQAVLVDFNFISFQGLTCNFVKRKCQPELKMSAQSLAQERKGKQSVQKRSRYISTVDIQHSTSSSTRNVRITQNIHAFSWGYVVKKNLDDISSGKSGGISVYQLGVPMVYGNHNGSLCHCQWRLL